MSDIQELIHTNAHKAYAIGIRTERARIIKLLEESDGENLYEAIELIKGDEADSVG